MELDLQLVVLVDRLWREFIQFEFRILASWLIKKEKRETDGQPDKTADKTQKLTDYNYNRRKKLDTDLILLNRLISLRQA